MPNPPVVRPTLVLALAAAMLAACGERTAEPPATAAPPPAPREPVRITDDTETVTARYACPGAAEVDIIRDGRFARLRMIDGRIVHLGSIQGSAPPVWSDVGLRFVVDGDFVELAQTSGRTIACSALPTDDAAAATDDAAAASLPATDRARAFTAA